MDDGKSACIRFASAKVRAVSKRYATRYRVIGPTSIKKKRGWIAANLLVASLQHEDIRPLDIDGRKEIVYNCTLDVL